MTYSLSVKGVRADSAQQPQTLTLSDDNARAASQQLAMRLGTQFLCKGPDGAERYYQIDAERSIPGYAPILLPVGSS